MAHTPVSAGAAEFQQNVLADISVAAIVH